MQPAIYVEDLWKRYVLLHSRPRRIKDAVLRRLLGRHSSREEFWALRGVSFEVAAGEAIGIIGPNGSGKSTVLGVLSRLLRPTKGVVQVQGRVGALLEASAGFHPDLTGIENVQMIASLMGLSRKETLARLPAIMEFAGAREFMDAAVRTYSTGMFARLAFSTVVHLEPDVLLLDEILAVGDEEFHEQCYRRLAQMRERGCAIVFVSHIVEQIRRVCQRVIWLESGRIVATGPTEEVISRYTGA